LSHNEAGELLGALALDAIDETEREAVDRHVRECGACQAEVAQHREVAAFLAPGWSAAPEGVWDRISASLEETPPPLTMPAWPVATAPPAPPLAPVVPIESRRRSRPVQIAAAIAAVAAVALVGMLGVKVVDDNRVIGQMKQQASGSELDRTVKSAMAAPGARKVTLQRSDGSAGANAVMLPDGTGYLVDAQLPDLSPDRTYQLWALVGTQRISVGVLGSKLATAGFKAPPTSDGFALTSEAAGGVVASRNDPVVVGKF